MGGPRSYKPQTGVRFPQLGLNRYQIETGFLFLLPRSPGGDVRLSTGIGEFDPRRGRDGPVAQRQSQRLIFAPISIRIRAGPRRTRRRSSSKAEAATLKIASCGFESRGRHERTGSPTGRGNGPRCHQVRVQLPPRVPTHVCRGSPTGRRRFSQKEDSAGSNPVLGTLPA